MKRINIDTPLKEIRKRFPDIEAFLRKNDHPSVAKAMASFKKAGDHAIVMGLGLNAGHDLSLENLKYFNDNINGLLEVSIGHALISDALYFGLENAVQMYLQRLK